MSPKKNQAPAGYFDYTVYPLEGVWSLTEEAIQSFEGSISKDDLVFELMVKQPPFVTPEVIETFRTQALQKTKNERVLQVRLRSVTEGTCVQMLHQGGFDREGESFAPMEAFAQSQGLTRAEKSHREISLSDFRHTDVEKLKTVLRFRVRKVSGEPRHEPGDSVASQDEPSKQNQPQNKGFGPGLLELGQAGFHTEG